MASKHNVGDIVWAKMKGFPAWPGKIIEPKPEVKRPQKKGVHFVFFFGSENYAWIPDDGIFAYREYKDKFNLTTRVPRGFREAVESCEDVLKSMPEESAVELPSIEEELAQIFPTHSPGHKDYTRESLSGKKNKERRDSSRREMKPEIKKDSEPRPRGRPPKRPSSPASDTPSAKRRGRPPGRPRRSVSVDNSEPEKPDPADKNIFTQIVGKLDLKATNGTEEVEEGVEVEDNVPATESEPPAAASPVKQAIIPTVLKIGFLGTGNMGQAMAANLMRAGHEVTVWNRTATKCRDLVKAGALKGTSAADVVSNCDISFSCVSNPEALKDLVFGNLGVLQGIGPGKGFVDMSTVDVDTSKDVWEAVTARGGRYLEAPVSGSLGPAEKGRLIILAAGDRTLYEDCHSCFSAMGKKTFFLGEVGNGCRMKLVVNMLLGTLTAGLAESMALAEKVGLDQDELLQVLEMSALDSPALRSKGNAMFMSQFETQFALRHQQKDLRLAITMADEVEQPLHVTASANELFKKAKAKGYGDHDSAAVYRAADS